MRRKNKMYGGDEDCGENDYENEYFDWYDEAYFEPFSDADGILEEILKKSNAHKGKHFSDDTDMVQIQIGEEDGAPKDEAVPDKTASAEASAVNLLEALVESNKIFTYGESETKSKKDEKAPEEPETPDFPKPSDYSPDDNYLIKEYKFEQYPYRYSCDPSVRRDAIESRKEKPKKCTPVYCDLITPRHSKLNKKQLKWYVYWRSLVENGEYPETYTSYVYLFINEIINLPDVIEPEKGVVYLAELLRHYPDYFEAYSVLNWIMEYCTLNHVRFPVKDFSDLLVNFPFSIHDFPFYTGNKEYTNEAMAYIRLFSSYDIYDGHSKEPNLASIYRKHIYACAESFFSDGYCHDYLCKHIKNVESSFFPYYGAICPYARNIMITVTYISAKSRQERRSVQITLLIKYMINCVRTIVGIKSRLKTSELDEKLKKPVDGYFAPYLTEAESRAAAEKKRRADEKRLEKLRLKEREEELMYHPEYYEPESSGISREAAEKIERNAWTATGMLVNSFEDGPAENEETPAAPAAEKTVPAEAAAPEADKNAACGGDGELAAAALRAIYEERYADFERLALENNMLTDTLAEKANEYAFGIIGDIALGQNEYGRYEIIKDYAGDIAEWMKK